MSTVDAAVVPGDALGSWLGFASSALQALAWPLIVLVLGVIFRESVRGLVLAFSERIQQMTAIKLPGFEASWAAGLQSATVELDKATDLHLVNTAVDPPDARATDTSAAAAAAGAEQSPAARAVAANAAELALVSPPAAVIAAFLPLERAIREYLQAAGDPITGSLVRAFIRSPRAPSNLKRAVSELSTLRNRAAHEPELVLSARDAMDYVAAAEDAVLQVNRGADSLRNP